VNTWFSDVFKGQKASWFVDQCVWQPMEDIETGEDVSEWVFHCFKKDPRKKGKRTRLCAGNYCKCDWHESAAAVIADPTVEPTESQLDE